MQNRVARNTSRKRNNFEGQLRAFPPKVAGPLLPLAHVTDFGRFLTILREGQFDPPIKCGVYDEYLIYTFSGRPDYRLRDDGYTYSDVVYAPVCLLLRPLRTPVKRILPFDSGGFDRYGKAMHPSWTRADFELNGTPDAPMYITGTFFEKNSNYFDRKALPGLKFKNSAEKLRLFYQLITNQLPAVFDQRCSAIEVQLSAPVSLKDTLIAVALPSSALDEETAADITAIGALVLPYPFEMPFRPGNFFLSIRSAVRAYFQDSGLL
ncbi:MAG TPA: hypothetical protein VGH07_09315 [Chthoniobacterales bacterium]|jgi:hypothetical protein